MFFTSRPHISLFFSLNWTDDPPRRANSRLAEANSKLLITSSLANGSLGGPSLDVGSLGSPAHYGATLGPLNRSLGLGRSLLSPVTDGQSSRVEDYLAKVGTGMNGHGRGDYWGNSFWGPFSFL